MRNRKQFKRSSDTEAWAKSLVKFLNRRKSKGQRVTILFQVGSWAGDGPIPQTYTVPKAVAKKAVELL